MVLNRTDDDDDSNVRCPPLVMEPGTIGWKARAVGAVVVTTRRRAAVENFMILVSVEIATVWNSSAMISRYLSKVIGFLFLGRRGSLVDGALPAVDGWVVP